RFGLTVPAARTAVCGASASGEPALAIGHKFPHLYGVIFPGLPGGGYRPPNAMPAPLPRTYLVAGPLKPFSRERRSMGGRTAQCGRGRRVARAACEARSSNVARRVAVDGRVGV